MKILLERGSMHIQTQKDILESSGSGSIPNALKVSRELEGYAVADYVVIPSRHVKDSFLEHGYSEQKIFMNPYGANLDLFYPISNIVKEYDVITVCTWCIQKGSDLLVDALSGTDLSLLHIGQIGDLPFPDSPNFYHIDHVDNLELVYQYNKAKIFILPSRQEGLALVLLEALACGLPVICSEFTGGRYILDEIDNKSLITVVPTDAGALRKAALEAMQKANSGMIKDLGQIKNKFSWKAYGERYAEFIDSIIDRKYRHTEQGRRKKVKINILTSSRFHVVDLARELVTQGFDVRIYSIVPKKRIMQFGVPKENISDAWLLTVPVVAFNLVALKFFPQNPWSRDMQTSVVDWIFGRIMRRCDVLIAMSGSFLASLKIARKW